MCDPWKEGLMSKKERMSGPHESLKLSVLWKLASRDWEDRLKTARKYLSKASVRKNGYPKYTRNTLAHVCACRLAPARGPRGPPWDNSKAIRFVSLRQGFSLELKAPQLAWAHKVHSVGCHWPQRPAYLCLPRVVITRAYDHHRLVTRMLASKLRSSLQQL